MRNADALNHSGSVLLNSIALWDRGDQDLETLPASFEDGWPDIRVSRDVLEQETVAAIHIVCLSTRDTPTLITTMKS